MIHNNSFNSVGCLLFQCPLDILLEIRLNISNKIPAPLLGNKSPPSLLGNKEAFGGKRNILGEVSRYLKASKNITTKSMNLYLNLSIDTLYNDHVKKEISCIMDNSITDKSKSRIGDYSSDIGILVDSVHPNCVELDYVNRCIMYYEPKEQITNGTLKITYKDMEHILTSIDVGRYTHFSLSINPSPNRTEQPIEETICFELGNAVGGIYDTIITANSHCSDNIIFIGSKTCMPNTQEARTRETFALVYSKTFNYVKLDPGISNVYSRALASNIFIRNGQKILCICNQETCSIPGSTRIFVYFYDLFNGNLINRMVIMGVRDYLGSGRLVSISYIGNRLVYVENDTCTNLLTLIWLNLDYWCVEDTITYQKDPSNVSDIKLIRIDKNLSAMMVIKPKSAKWAKNKYPIDLYYF